MSQFFIKQLFNCTFHPLGLLGVRVRVQVQTDKDWVQVQTDIGLKRRRLGAGPDRHRTKET